MIIWFKEFIWRSLFTKISFFNSFESQNNSYYLFSFFFKCVISNRFQKLSDILKVQSVNGHEIEQNMTSVLGFFKSNQSEKE